MAGVRGLNKREMDLESVLEERERALALSSVRTEVRSRCGMRCGVSRSAVCVWKWTSQGLAGGGTVNGSSSTAQHYSTSSGAAWGVGDAPAPTGVAYRAGNILGMMNVKWFFEGEFSRSPQRTRGREGGRERARAAARRKKKK
jgi:hypothetical protein